MESSINDLWAVLLAELRGQLEKENLPPMETNQAAYWRAKVAALNEDYLCGDGSDETRYAARLGFSVYPSGTYEFVQSTKPWSKTGMAFLSDAMLHAFGGLKDIPKSKLLMATEFDLHVNCFQLGTHDGSSVCGLWERSYPVHIAIAAAKHVGLVLPE